MFFFFKQKTAYEMRISDWSSDVCSSDLKTRTLSGPGTFGATGTVQASQSLGGNVSRMLAKGPTMRSRDIRSEEHTSELQSLMRISYAVFCLKKKKINYALDIHLYD